MSFTAESPTDVDRRQRQNAVHRLCTLAVLLAVSAIPAIVHATPATDQVREAHAAIDRQLSSVNNRVNDDWRSYLALEQIEEQLDRGDNADPKTVLNILERYAIRHEVLERSPYDLGRPAIEAWLAEIASPADLPAIVSQTAENATLPKPPTARRTLATLRRAVREMDRYLADRFPSKAQQNWRKYLHWNDLNEQLATDEPDVEVLAEIARRYQGATPLFRERRDQTIQTTADALNRAVRDLRRRQSTDAQLQQQLRSLADRLLQQLKNPSDATAEAIGQPLGWLRDRQLHLALLNTIDKYYRRPNLYVDVSRRLAAAGVEFTEDVPSAINANVNGIHFTGQNRAKSRLDMHWDPSDDHAAVKFSYKANVATDARGQEQGVTFRSQGIIRVSGEKQLTLDETGLDWRPAVARAVHESEIVGTNAGSREIGYIYDNKPATEREVERRAAADARRRLNDDAQSVFGAAQRFLVYKLRIPMMIRDAFPADLRMRTTAERMMLSATQATPSQLAAASDPPSVPDGADLSFRLHESIITNAAAALLNKQTMNELEIETFMADYLGFAPADLRTEDKDRLWSVSFADEHPIVTSLDDGILTIRLRADRFHVGEKEYPAMQIAAHYKLVDDTSGLVGERKGRITILPLDYKKGDRLGARWSTFRTLFRRRFDRVFPEIILLDRFRLGGTWNWFGELEIQEFSADRGWLALHYRVGHRRGDSAPDNPRPAADK